MPPAERSVIEEFLDGEEASLFALCDGSTALEIGTAQDHKRAFDGDLGPNTGGMGAYSPAPLLDAAMVERAMAEIVRPTLAGMAAEGAPFTGILYAGLMLTATGPKLIEYNVRFGDPECQVILPRLMTDLAQLMLGAVDGMLGHMSLRWLPTHALTVVMAAQGYPGAYATGSEIRGLEALAGDPDLLLFHAGTRRDGRRPAARRRRAGPERHRPRRHAWPRRGTAPTPPSTGSTGRRASAAATSAGAPWRVEERARYCQAQ